MNPAPEPTALPPRGSFWVTLLAALGCFLIFVVVLYLAYLPRREDAATVDLAKIPPEEQWKYTPAGRASHLAEMRAHEHDVATTYAWIDRAHGVVQLPLDRAMELTLRDLRAPPKP